MGASLMGAGAPMPGHPAPHVFTTRSLGTSPVSDVWARGCAELGSRTHLSVPLQVHGDDVIVPCRRRVSGHRIFDACASAADIIMTRDVDTAVAVQAADCVPLLFFDASTGAVAAAHAGWRGTAAGVVRTATRAMADHFSTRAENLIVAIGPSIGPCCYQVGDELLGAFGPGGRRWFYQLGGVWMLNLWNANRDQLVEAGVRSGNIHVADLCTAMHPDLFDSYRRDGKDAGRLAAAIRMNPTRSPR